MGKKEEWFPVIQQCPNVYNYLAPDLPGHGKTRILIKQEYFSLSGMANLILNHIIKPLNIRHLILVGYSMGGRLALTIMEQIPEKITGLVLESANPGIAGHQERKKREVWDTLQAKKLRTMPFRDFLQEWYKQPLFDSLRKQPFFPELLNDKMHHSPFKLSLVMKYAGTGTMRPKWNFIRQSTVPIMYISGEYDKKYVGIGQQLNRINPSISHIIIKNAGHNVHLEQPASYINYLNRFFLSL